ncbi:MAG: acyl-CoA dehydrogenase family protein, partial [Chloroflexota bacterium]|nr:acyl-CoA dehydrogenase family protein [Chloroflexota bacterium]
AHEIAPGAAERDRDGIWFAEGWRKMGELGLLGLQFPEEFGGSGASIVTTAAAFQAFTAGGADAGIALSWVAHSVLAGTPIWLFGTPDQKRRYLSGIARGASVAGYGLTEPSAGSDAASLQTTARRVGDRWILNGSKMFITNAPIGDVFVVFASHDLSLRSRGITAFIVERGFPGFSSGKELDKMGNRTSPTGELVLSDCEVPLENILGKPGQGFVIAKTALEWERFLMMAHSVGTMQAVIADCLRYSREREQFGQPISAQPAIQVKLAEMQLQASVGELFVRRVAWLKDEGRSTPLESSTCKIFCSEAVMRTASEGVQIHGGYGYMRESAVERAMRDARLAAIGGGTTEIQRQVVGRQVLAGEPAQGLSQGQPPSILEGGEDLRQVVAGVMSSGREGLALARQAMAVQTERWSGRFGWEDSNRLFAAAIATGIAEAALARAVQAVRARPGGQLIEQRLADVRTRADGAWLATSRAAWAMDSGKDGSQRAIEARIFAVEAALFCTDAAFFITGDPSNDGLLELATEARKLALQDGSLDDERLGLARLMLQPAGAGVVLGARSA